MKYLLSAVVLISLSFVCGAQGTIANLNYLRKEDVEDLSNRKIVVIKYTEALNENIRYEAKKAKAKEKDIPFIEKRIAENIELDNTMEEALLPAVKEYWTLGDKSEIRYVSVAEMKELIKNKTAKEYAIVMVRSFTKSASIYDGTGISRIELSAICFQGMENYGKNMEILAFPLVVSQESWGFSHTDISTSIKILNNYAEEVKKSDKKVTLSDYLDLQVEENCEMNNQHTLHIRESMLKDATSEDVRAKWPGDVEMSSSEGVFEGYSPSSADVFAVFIPSQIAEGSIGPLSQQALIYTRLVVQPSTGKILGYAKTKMGEVAGDLFYKKGHLEDVGTCGK